MRRVLIACGVALALGGGFVAAGGQNLFYSVLTQATSAQQLDPSEAHELATSGQITLIDIRRPDEWARTGSGQGAVRLDMRRDDFLAELEKIVGGDTGKPVALICARGVRSARLSNRLEEAGFSNIIDIPEGMLGSAAGPGWLGRALPLDKS